MKAPELFETFARAQVKNCGGEKENCCGDKNQISQVDDPWNRNRPGAGGTRQSRVGILSGRLCQEDGTLAIRFENRVDGGVSESDEVDIRIL
jgi:hypothetical protein